MKRGVLVLLSLVATSASAAADESHHVALVIAGTHAGFVRSVEGDGTREDGTTPMSVRLDALAPAASKLVASWLEGKATKTDFALTTSAIVRKVHDARIASVRLPAIGFGAIDPVEIAFETRGISNAPSLKPASDAALPQGAKLATFHVDVAGKPARVAKLGALSLERGPSTPVTPGELAIEVAAGETSPWAAWLKAPAGRPVQIAYVTADDKPVVRVTLEGCRPTSMKPTNGPTSRVLLSCSIAR